MTNEFKIAAETNKILIKIIQFLQVLIVGFACYLYFFKNISIGQISLFGGLGGILMVLIYSLKKYKIIGKITIDSDKILIDSKELTIDLPFNIIRRIGFNIKGVKKASCRPSLIQPVGVNLPNGIGNFIEIETNESVYKLDILLRYSIDSNSLEHQIDRLTALGLKVDKVKLPRILGDFV
jgi:hypothetical protein